MYIAAPSSSYCSRTLAATDATCSHEVAAQSQPTLLLPSSSSTIAATLSCPPLGDFNPVVPTLLSFTTSNLKIVAILFRLDKLFLKCHIQLNQLWVLMQCSLISSYFHDFTEEYIMMLKVFPDDDLRSTTHNCKKEQEKDIHMTPTTMMPSISMLALPERGNVFVLRVDTSKVGIDVTLIQDGL
ncbi:hypothetical protein BHE74_00055192 [Ensete ventricosum]|nr:hypothetical protein BHE74_00055192 [Ensete ventricosum]RZS08977.1 hypothetical protein BHM03_00040013 [Ensete ventricosum]